MDENNKKNEISTKEDTNNDLTEEEQKFNNLIKSNNYNEIKNLLNPELSEIKIWEYKTKEKDGSTILHLSILQNNNKIIKRIINYTKNYLSKEDLSSFINKKNKSGITSLHLASYKGNLKIILLLISNGGDIHMLTEKKLNVIHYSCQGNKPNCLLFYDLKYKFDFNFPDKRFTTPLHWACFSSSYECVNFLLQRKNDININAQDIEGNTPLHLAILCGISKIVRLLLQKGALIDIKNNSGLTPMRLALKEKRIEIYNILITNKKLVICNLKAPAKKIQKSKKYAWIAIIFKFISYYIIFFHVYPFLFIHYENEIFDVIIFLIHIILNIFLIILFLYLICGDPGYIDDFDKINDFQNLLIKKKETFLDFCFKCSVFKTDNIKHCVICDKCCKEFDHHCLWLDNCIGKNNYNFFKIILYNFFFDILINIIIAIFSLVAFYMNDDDDDKEYKNGSNNEETLHLFYDFLKNCFYKLEIFSNYIHIISIIFLSINVLITIPLIYLLKLHFKLCKKEKSNVNNNLLKREFSSIDSDKLFGSNNDEDEISLF